MNGLSVALFTIPDKPQCVRDNGGNNPASQGSFVLGGGDPLPQFSPAWGGITGAGWPCCLAVPVWGEGRGRGGTYGLAGGTETCTEAMGQGSAGDYIFLLTSCASYTFTFA